nr:monogalactosyldiacylglycerol synthase, chloroplastic-like [Tanacetum cinerariifolium]
LVEVTLEDGNVPYVVENGCGKFSKSPKEIATIVGQWFGPKVHELNTMSENALRLAKPDSVFKIVQGINSYEFLLANKKCVVNADVFKMILDICLRVEGVNFTDVPYNDTKLAFLIKLGYKGPLKEKRSRRENMPFPQFTKIIINHFLKQHKSLSNLKYQHYHTIKDDGIVNRLKFVRIGEDYQEYGLAILEVMLNDETVDVSEESEHEPKPVKRTTVSRRVVKKKVIIFGDENIIPDPDVALELGKSISLTEVKEKEAARQVHVTHARIVTEYVPESAKATSKPKLKGVLDESIVVSTISSEGTGTKPGIPDEEKDITKENVSLKWGSEEESEYSEEDQLDDEEKGDKEGDIDDEDDDHISDAKDTNDEDDETESNEDEIYKYKISADAEKTEEAKDDSKKAKLPLTSSSLSISLGFSDQFLKLSSDTSLVGTVKDTTNAEIISLLDVKIQHEVPHIQSPSVLRVPVFVISEPTVLTPIHKLLLQHL